MRAVELDVAAVAQGLSETLINVVVLCVEAEVSNISLTLEQTTLQTDIWRSWGVDIVFGDNCTTASQPKAIRTAALELKKVHPRESLLQPEQFKFKSYNILKIY